MTPKVFDTSSLLAAIDAELRLTKLPRDFGLLKLDLTDMKARQAELMCQATAGQERQAWREAASFLAAREAVQYRLQRCVRQAMLSAQDLQFEQALGWLDRAQREWPADVESRALCELRSAFCDQLANRTGVLFS